MKYLRVRRDTSGMKDMDRFVERVNATPTQVESEACHAVIASALGRLGLRSDSGGATGRFCSDCRRRNVRFTSIELRFVD